MIVDAGPTTERSHDGSLWFQLALPLREIRETIEYINYYPRYQAEYLDIGDFFVQKIHISQQLIDKLIV